MLKFMQNLDTSVHRLVQISLRSSEMLLNINEVKMFIVVRLAPIFSG